jgi:hypothetical protein
MICPTPNSKTEMTSRNTFVTKLQQQLSGKWTAMHDASGNDGAFTLVEAMEKRMARMEKKLTEQAEELVDQKEKVAGRNRLSCKFRVSELKRIIKKTQDAARFKRNEIVHGADVLNDYQALEYADQPDNQPQFKTASKGFKKAYGSRLGSLSYDNLKHRKELLIS